MKKLYRFIVVLASLMTLSTSCILRLLCYEKSDIPIDEVFQIQNDLGKSVTISSNIDEWGRALGEYRILPIKAGDTLVFARTCQPDIPQAQLGLITVRYDGSVPPIIHIYDADDNVVYSAILFSYRKETPAFFDSSFWECVPPPYPPYFAGGSLINSVYLLKLSSIIDTSSHI